MAKRRAEAAREGKENPFGVATVHALHDKMRRKTSASLVTHPLSNHMLDLPEEYLDNISAAATLAVENGFPLYELSASLVVSVETITAQANDIKRLYQQINALKRKGLLTPVAKRMQVAA